MNPESVVFGNLYFIKDEYFVDFPYDYLMENKDIVDGKIHNRPCFYSAIDNNGILWFIPVSSKIDKYQKEYDKKMAKYNRDPDTIVFGFVRGNKNAFLIQNMFPVTIEYLNNVYIDVGTNAPVILSTKLKEDLEQKARKVLNIHRRGKKLIFPDVLEIERKLLGKLAGLGLAEVAVGSQKVQDEIAKDHKRYL